MAKNTNRRPPAAGSATGRKTATAQPLPAAAAPARGFRPSIHLIYQTAVGIITFLFLQVCLENKMTNWDDPGYIINDPNIKDLSPEGLKAIFSTSIMGNYHPFTILSYAIEYSYVRLEPYHYHLDSLLLHILVTLLVYWFVVLLTRRPLAAAIASLLFGLHPMHVESVAWLAGRKDVIYGSFYLLACIAWVYYIRAVSGKRLLWYAATVLLFVCSLLGKPVAVVLPLALLLIDYFENRSGNGNKNEKPAWLPEIAFFKQRGWSYWLVIEKLPLFAISVFFGLRSIADQKKFGSLDADNIAYNFLERIALGSYALFTYLWKAVAPLKLCNFYPYPLKKDGVFDSFYYIYPAIAAVIIFAVCFLWRRNKTVVFGTLFFLVNIILLLQFLPVGGAIVAERYSYIPYLGLFFILGQLVAGAIENGSNKSMGYGLLAVTLGWSLWLGYLANERCKVWYDTTTLWRDEIEKEPHDAPNAWNNLGFNYFNKYNESVNQADRSRYFDSAALCLNKAIELQPTFVNPYISMGELQRTAGTFDPPKQQYYFGIAKQYYYKALSLKSFDEGPNAYLGLGIIYAITHRFDSSEYCFRKAITGQPQFPEAHSNFGNFFDMTGRPDSALVQYGISIAQNPDIFPPHLNRGRLLFRLHRYDEALKDFDMCVALAPENGEVYYFRGIAWKQKGNNNLAEQDFQKARTLGFKQ